MVLTDAGYKLVRALLDVTPNSLSVTELERITRNSRQWMDALLEKLEGQGYVEREGKRWKWTVWHMQRSHVELKYNQSIGDASKRIINDIPVKPRGKPQTDKSLFIIRHNLRRTIVRGSYDGVKFSVVPLPEYLSLIRPSPVYQASGLAPVNTYPLSVETKYLPTYNKEVVDVGVIQVLLVPVPADLDLEKLSKVQVNSQVKYLDGTVPCV